MLSARCGRLQGQTLERISLEDIELLRYGHLLRNIIRRDEVQERRRKLEKAEGLLLMAYSEIYTRPFLR